MQCVNLVWIFIQTIQLQKKFETVGKFLNSKWIFDIKELLIIYNVIIVLQGFF